jgi:hypothetical protein
MKAIMRATLLGVSFCVAIVLAGATGYVLGTDSPLRTTAEPSAEQLKNATDYVQRVLSQKGSSENLPPLVPNAEVAVAIHNAVGGAIFGKFEMAHEQPFTAIRCGDFWLVTGYLLPDWLGGTATTVIRARNGEVVYIEAQE